SSRESQPGVCAASECGNTPEWLGTIGPSKHDYRPAAALKVLRPVPWRRKYHCQHPGATGILSLPHLIGETIEGYFFSSLSSLPVTRSPTFLPVSPTVWPTDFVPLTVASPTVLVPSTVPLATFLEPWAVLCPTVF